jgi:hypothetical protein
VRPALLPFSARIAPASALALALVLGAESARAHLLPAQRGTVNVVGNEVFTAVSIPASALEGADDDRDGHIDAGELERHEEALRAQFDRRLAVFDGDTPAATVRIDLVLSPQHDASGGRADQIVVLEHSKLDAPPRDLRVRCDLFGKGPSERSLTLTATRNPGGAAETQVAVLTSDATEQAFFSPVKTAPSPVWFGAPVLSALAALGLSRRSRRRPASEARGERRLDAHAAS